MKSIYAMILENCHRRNYLILCILNLKLHKQLAKHIINDILSKITTGYSNFKYLVPCLFYFESVDIACICIRVTLIVVIVITGYR